MVKILLIVLVVAVPGLVLYACSSPSRLLNSVISDTDYRLITQSYGEHPRQAVDVYEPRKAVQSGKPVVVFIHGGAWRTSGKAEYKFVAQALSQLGYVVIIPEYRVYPEVKFPAFVEDVVSALSAVNQHMPELLNRAQNRVILMGHSSGAHTAALLMTDPAYFKQSLPEVQVAGLVGLAGPYDLPMQDPEVVPVFEGFSPDQVNPVRQVRSDMPPVLLLHGLKDDRVKPFHTRHFADVLQQAGGEVETKLYDDVAHVSILAGLAMPLRFINNSYADLVTFLRRYE